MRKLIAVFLFIFWPGLMLSPGQALFFSQNVRPASTGGAITSINSAVNGALTISGNATSQTLGFTTSSSHFFVAVTYVGATDTVTSATLEPSGTAMICPTANQMDGARTLIWVCYLANGPSGQTSVNWGYSGSNGSPALDAFLEYSGMSLTAAPVNSSVTCPGSFTGATSWSCGPYTATSNNLVWSTCGTLFGVGSVSGFSPWNNRLESEGNTSNMNMWFFDRLAPTAGSYTGASSFTNSNAGMFYDCMTGSFA